MRQTDTRFATWPQSFGLTIQLDLFTRLRVMSSDLTTGRSAVVPITTQLRVGGFEDAVEIGRGGFGVVYRCRQVELDRVVAVKVLTVDMDENRVRFDREQRAMAS